MNIYLKFDVQFDESKNIVDIYLKRTSSSLSRKLESVRVVGHNTVKIRRWHHMMDINYKISKKMKNMLHKYFKMKDRNKEISKQCNQFSKEQYNLSDQATLDFLNGNGIET